MRLFHPRPITLDRYANGGLPAARRERIARHLAACAQCRQRVQALSHIELALTPDHFLNDAITRQLLASLGPAEWRHERLVGELRQVVGLCRIEPAHGGPAAEGFDGLGLKPGDRLRVADEGLARLELSDGSQIWVDRQTEATLDEREGSLKLRKGRLFAKMQPQRRPYTIETPQAQLTVLGTTFEAAVTPYESTLLRVLEGRVAYRNEAGEAMVPRRRQVDAAAHQHPRALPIPRPGEVGAWVRALAGPVDAAWSRAEWRWRVRLASAGLLLLVLAGTGGALYWHGLGPALLRRGGQAREQYQEPRHTTVEPDASLVAAGVRWPVGTRFTHRLELSSRSENRLPGVAQPVLQELRQTQDVTLAIVSRAPAGDREVEARLGNIKLELTKGDQRLYLDTAANSFKDSHHPLAALLRAQLAARFRLRISPTGHIERLDGFDTFKQVVLGQLGDEHSALTDRLLNEDAYRQMFGLFTVPDLPAGPIVVGRQWTVRAPGASADAGQEQYTFERWDLYKGHRCALFKVSLTAAGESGTPSGEALQTAGAGRVWFDPELGMALKTAWSVDKQVTTGLSPDQTGATRKISSSINQYLASNLVDVKSGS